MIFNYITNPTNKNFYWGATYLLIALSFVFIANDNTFSFLISNPSFYTDILFSIFATFGVGFYLKYLNKKFDVKYDWYAMFTTRLTKQMIFGILLPFVIAMLLEILYLKIIHIPLVESSMFNLEMPLAFIFLILLNLISLSNYLIKNKKIETLVIKDQIVVNPSESLKSIIGYKGYTEEKIAISNCALIRSANKILWLITFDGETFRVQGTMEEWGEKLKDSNFYRINRQYLSSFNAIKSIEQTETRKLKVNFVISLEDDVYISKPNIAFFKQWWKK